MPEIGGKALGNIGIPPLRSGMFQEREFNEFNRSDLQCNWSRSGFLPIFRAEYNMKFFYMKKSQFIELNKNHSLQSYGLEKLQGLDSPFPNGELAPTKKEAPYLGCFLSCGGWTRLSPNGETSV